MAFDSYRRVDDVVKRHKLIYSHDWLLPPDESSPPLSAVFRRELEFNLRKLPVGRCRNGRGAMLLFPILREVWKPYCDDLALFTHEMLTYDDDLTGVPDYFVCKVSEYGQTIPDIPVLLIAEAKLDDFEKAWGQCSATMLAAQKLNQTPDMPVYGIATNGGSWQFGMLLGRELTVDPNGTSLSTLDALTQRLHSVMRAVLVQAKAYTKPVAA